MEELITQGIITVLDDGSWEIDITRYAEYAGLSLMQAHSALRTICAKLGVAAVFNC